MDNGCDKVANLAYQNKCGLMSQLDSGAAQLADHLKSTSQWENTIFFFVSTGGSGGVSSSYASEKVILLSLSPPYHTKAR
jgi:arylsulfatase A-like enzyme